MAVSAQPLRDRLVQICKNCFMGLKVEDLPFEIQPRYRQFLKDMTSNAGTCKWLGSIQETAMSMGGRKAKRLSQDVVDMYLEIKRAYYGE
ncbi:MAG TPA: hypothetical protein V6C52_10710 [Coleofasciculaceae cyanobacterium]|jgi:hypothetical protein